MNSFVESFLTDLSLIPDTKKGRTAVTTVTHTPWWIPPPQGMIKINVDMTVGKNTGRGAIVAVTNNDVGRFLGASAVVLPGKTAPKLWRHWHVTRRFP